ncbi:39S ribosomal protein L21, mitochondrial-like protein [Sarcoptes scabiei]|uniref:Large ribosomal subunit protein bL21m n=1 Tax=Sarcoptes scabiei TaxID=52283 RepID=A0A132A9M3_SARSC|nr:39S ribosomal protein L21, mitochondrial-like protein [Sarcoptes scabiei]
MFGLHRISNLNTGSVFSTLLKRFASLNNDVSYRKILQTVNSIIETKNLGQTFAVIHLYNKQHLVHLGDIIAVRYPIQADIGERIKIEKCLLFGNENFTLIGRPVLNRDLIQIEATVIEKTMTQTYMDMFHKPRSHGLKRYLFHRYPLTMLRINEINI